MKSRKLISVLVAVCMLVSSLATIAFAADGEFICSNVSFGYITGDVWTDATELEAGKDLSAKISVSKSGEAESVIFSLIVYNEDKIYDVSTITQEVSTQTVLTVTASLPESTDDCYVSAFLWDNYVDMTPICNISGFPDASVAVTGISIDGVELPNFDPAIKTYEFAVSGDRKLKPVVEVTTLDLGAKVTVTDPTRFPGSSVIKVTNGSGDENIYTVNYTFAGGLVRNIDYTQNVYENITQAMAIPEVYRDFQVGSKAYYDRAFVVTDVTDESYLGMDYIGAGLGWKNSPPYRDYYGTKPSEWLQFTLDRDGVVKIVTQSAIAGLKDLGYEETNVANLIAVDVNGSSYVHDVVYTKSFEKGEQVVLPSMFSTTGLFIFFEFKAYEEPAVPGEEITGIEIESKPDKTEYTAGEELDLTGLKVNSIWSNGDKVEIDDYEVSSCDMSAGTHTITVSYEGFTVSFDIIVEAVTFGLNSLSVDGTPVAGFDIAKTEYTVTIPATQAKFPVVEAVATEGGTTEVTNPTSFPGSATVTVSKAGEDDVVYTLNYATDKAMVTDLSVLGDNKIPEAYGGGNASPLPEYTGGGFVVGAYAYNDRKDRTENGTRYVVLEINDPSLAGGDYITGGITWYNGKTPTVTAFSSADNLDWVQFTVNRAAKVHVLKHHSNDKEKFEAHGYTQTISTNEHGYLYTLLNGTNHRYHKYMYSQEFAPGEKVTVPNSLDNNNTYHIVITYDSYEEIEAAEPEVTLSGIEITSEPAKVAYTEGEELDLTGLVVKANYSDSSSEEITSYTVSECDMSVGNHTITVTYEGYTDSFDITVEEAAPEEAELVYDIAYTDNVYANTTVTATTFKPYVSENLQVDSPAYFCRDGVNDTRTSFITAVGDNSYLGLSYMGVGIAWKNSPPFRDYYATDPDQWFKFTVGKDVKITLLTTAKVDAFESTLEFTYEAKSNALKTIINNATNYTFGHTYTKTFNAGDTIVFPSFRSSNALIILFEEVVSEQ